MGSSGERLPFSEFVKVAGSNGNVYIAKAENGLSKRGGSCYEGTRENSEETK